LAPHGVSAMAHDPVEVKSPFESAAAIAPLPGQVAGRLAHEAARQGRGPRGSEEHLRLAGVRTPRGGHLAVAPGLCRDPPNRVVAVPLFAPAVVDERTPRTFGA